MKLRFRSLVQKQVLYLLLVAFSIILLLSTYFYYYSKQALIRRTYDQLIAIREIKKKQIESLLEDKISDLGIVSGYFNFFLNENYTNEAGNKPDLNVLMSSPNFEQVGIRSMHLVIQSKGELDVRSIYSKDSIQLPDSLRTSFLEKAFGFDGPMLSDYLPAGSNLQSPQLLVSIPVNPGNQENGDSALMLFRISAESIINILLEYSAEKGFGNTGEAYLVGPDYRLRSESRFLQGALGRIDVKSEAVLHALSGEEGILITHDYRDVKVYSAYAPLSLYGLKWAILSEIDHQEAMIPLISIRNDIVFLTVVIGLFILAISVFLAYSIVNPLKKLEKAVKKFGQGELFSIDEPQSVDEIGRLTESFMNMAQQINAQNTALSEERNRRLSAMYDGQEIERQRISRELHDGLGQVLAGVKLKLENLGHMPLKDQEGLVVSVKGNLTDALDELHRIVHNLRPPVLNELGLITALHNLCDEFSKDTGIQCEMSEFGDFGSIPTQTANYLYRICQEGMNNIARHASAKNVQLQAIENPQAYIVLIEDDGKGFCYSSKALTQGHGLFNIHERVALLGGKVSFETGPDKGTTIRIKIPKQNP